jgi:type IV pilus assembly protein PilW
MKNLNSSVSNYFTFHQKTQAENGFTLLELLIALLIGALVIAVVGSLFLANTNTFRTVDDASRLQENGRFALQTVARVTRQAGFIPADVAQLFKNPEDAYLPNVLQPGSTARIISGTDGTGSNRSDSLSVAFRASPNGQVVDCTGAQQAVPNPFPLNASQASIGAPVINTFFVGPSNISDATSNFSLFCSSGATGATGRVELIRGVESFQVLYAVDRPNPPSPGGGTALVKDFVPDYYTSANNLTGDQFNNVVGVQIALVLRGGERSTLDAPLTGNQLRLNLFGSAADGFTPLYDGTVNSDPGAVYQIQGADNIRRTFKVITSTINLRNRSA